MTTSTFTPAQVDSRIWSAVGSLTLCVALLIAAEFMPVSLLTPIANDLHTSQGMAGQAISISGFFAVVASLCIASIAGRFDRRHVLISMTVLMLVSLVVIALAPGFTWLMIARAFLGVAIGGFWALSTATVLRIVPEDAVPKALGMIYMGHSVAAAFAAPIGAYVGGHLGWRFVFAALVPIVIINVFWQYKSLPKMQPEKTIPLSRLFGVLKRRNVMFGLLAAMLTFGGTFTAFTYLRPFLEQVTGVDSTQLSILLLSLGIAGFGGTYLVSRLLEKQFLFQLLRWLPVALAVMTVALAELGYIFAAAAIMMFGWGMLYSAIPVCWSTWLAKEVSDEPETGGGLMVAAIQMAIMVGGAFGGSLLDHVSVTAPLIGGSALLILAALVVGNGERLTQSSPV